MAEWGRLSPKLEKCLNQAENILLDAFKIATEKYSNDRDFLWFYGYLISVFPEHFVSVYSDYLKAENTGKQMLNVASQMQYTLAIIFNEKFSEKDVLESGKKDLEIVSICCRIIKLKGIPIFLIQRAISHTRCVVCPLKLLILEFFYPC